MKASSNISTAQICLILAVCLMVFLFSESRNDPSLRIAALVAGTGLVASLSAIASTILTGKDVTKPDPADMPPGTLQTTTLQTPPLTVNGQTVQAPVITGIERESQ